MSAERAHSPMHRLSTVPSALMVVIATALLVGSIEEAAAQSDGASIAASTEITLPPVNGAGMQSLNFGTAQLGDVVDVPPGPAGAGATTSSAGWQFGNIRKGRWVSLTLTLPAALLRGGHAIPIDWNNANYGQLCVSKNVGSCEMTASFNPSASPSHSFQLANSLPGNNFDVLIYAGARVTIPANTPPGVYTATVTSVFAYAN